MKISFIEPHLHVVGGIRRIIEVSNRLMVLGNEVKIFSPSGKPCRWLQNSILTYPLSKIQKHSHDVVIFNLAEQYTWANKIKGAPKVFWVLAPEANYKAPEIPIKALKQGFFMMANSSFTVNYIRKHVKVKYDIPIIPGGINPQHFKRVLSTPKEFHVLYYGSKRPWKGTKIIEEALDGAGVKALKMEGLNTPQKKLWTLYNRCNCFVSACKAEGFSFPELEAMACGCPVITTNSGGNQDFVINGHNALVVNRDPRSLRKGMSKVLANTPLKRKLIQNGLKTAANPKYNWDNVTKKVEEVLLSVIKRNGK